jgi:DNA-binding beta-propeller fold protein YncE
MRRLALKGSIVDVRHAIVLLCLAAPSAPAAAAMPNKVWVSTALPGGVVRFDLDGRRQDLGVAAQSPIGVAIDSSGNAWVTAGNGLLWKLSPEGVPLATISVGGSPYGVVVDSTGNIWVTTGAAGRTVVKLSPEGERLFTIDSLDYPSGIAADPSGNVWVADTSRNLVFKFSPAGDRLFTVPGGGCPVDLAVDRAGNCWVSALCATQFVYCYSETGDFVGKYSIYGLGVAGIAIDGRQRLWIANPYTETVTVLGAEGQYLGYVRVGASPGGVAVDGDGYVWVANEGGRSVTRIHADERRIVGIFATGESPRTRGDLAAFVLANVVQAGEDFDGDGYANGEEIDAGKNPFQGESFPNAWLRGNVNTLNGLPPANVLYVNDRAGDLRGRLEVESWVPVTVYVDAPPTAMEPCRYVLYAMPGDERNIQPTEQPFGLGRMAFPTPLSGGGVPAVTLANNFDPPRRMKLGFPLLETDPSPSVVFREPRGFGRSVDVTLQGFIVDPGSSGPGVSVTNVIFLRVR